MSRTYKKISKAGSITLPAQMRRELGIQPSDFMEVELTDGQFKVKIYQHRCIFCGEVISGNIGEFKGKTICESCNREMRSVDIFNNKLNDVKVGGENE